MAEETRDKTMMLTVVLGGGFALLSLAVLGGAGALLYFGTAEASAGEPSVSVGAITDGGSAAGALAGSLTGAAGAGQDSYEPTSAYVEKGADSDVQVMGFDGDGGGGGGGARLSEYAIQDTIAQHQNDLIMCYAEGLEQNPDLQGRVDFHFRIAGDGHVAMVKVTRSGLRDRATEDCFVEKARQWSFPRTGGEALTKFDTDFNFTF